ncbi:hypothetical protein [Kitasatospora sp. A2-31]|uniref:hypothetical protein n=1 Tax=Kitasatospora sp. A2-31 TaxID=2916414 RepID=UPI001EEAE234|nr:hypothetical protein [Kitasatospora sp. A2-31]MCG6496623.1 hypothetical protein [Kitasatospora sp. A2-31]
MLDSTAVEVAGADLPAVPEGTGLPRPMLLYFGCPSCRLTARPSSADYPAVSVDDDAWTGGDAYVRCEPCGHLHTVTGADVVPATSTITCSRCAHVSPCPPSAATAGCDGCGLVHDGPAITDSAARERLRAVEGQHAVRLRGTLQEAKNRAARRRGLEVEEDLVVVEPLRAEEMPASAAPVVAELLPVAAEPEDVEEGPVDAELVDADDALFPEPADPGRHPEPFFDPALLPARTGHRSPDPDARPLVDRHTMLRPGQAVPTTADAPVYTEADFRISQSTADLIDSAAPANTSRAYRSARQQFETWCRAEGRVPWPCTTATFTEYVGVLIGRDMAPASIRVHMSAIRTNHQDGQQPGIKAASEALRGHARRRQEEGVEPKKAPGVSPEVLALLVASCDAETGYRRTAGLRDAALLTLGWGMLSRRSELSGLLISHIQVKPTGVRVRVGRSKTDQEGKGKSTFVPAVPDDPAVCPVARVSAWLEELRRHGHTTGPLFRRITRYGTMPAAGVRGRISPDSVGEIVKRHAAAALALLTPTDPHRLVLADLTAHGLRRGPAQFMADAGEDPTGQGRWKAGSTTVQEHYVEPAQGEQDNPLAAAYQTRAAERAAQAQAGVITPGPAGP